MHFIYAVLEFVWIYFFFGGGWSEGGVAWVFLGGLKLEEEIVILES